jgi:UDP-N-acetylmuramate: L-alanyl-gamma-D-glutamyl-meso-diaminopimelate ligase
VILNNLEFDHADIYDDLGAIRKQFHHLVRTVPAAGRILWNAGDANLEAVLDMGCWTPREGFARDDAGAPWSLRVADGGDYSAFEVLESGRHAGTVRWGLLGAHNAENALAAIGAARHAGVPVARAVTALGEFKGVKRRMELRGEVKGVAVYDDFAHHPTAIARTIDGLRRKVGDKRIVAVLEPRSATMKMGVHRDTLAPSLAAADSVWVFAPPDLGWDVTAVVRALGAKGRVARSMDELVGGIAGGVRPGDQVLVMSNGGFGGLHGKLLEALERS